MTRKQQETPLTMQVGVTVRRRKLGRRCLLPQKPQQVSLLLALAYAKPFLPFLSLSLSLPPLLTPPTFPLLHSDQLPSNTR